MVVHRIVMGEGASAQQCTSREETPSPFLLRWTTEQPSPARGEGATTPTAPAACIVAILNSAVGDKATRVVI